MSTQILPMIAENTYPIYRAVFSLQTESISSAESDYWKKWGREVGRERETVLLFDAIY